MYLFMVVVPENAFLHPLYVSRTWLKDSCVGGRRLRSVMWSEMVCILCQQVSVRAWLAITHTSRKHSRGGAPQKGHFNFLLFSAHPPFATCRWRVYFVEHTRSQSGNIISYKHYIGIRTRIMVCHNNGLLS
jgi:hypothetical protein